MIYITVEEAVSRRAEVVWGFLTDVAMIASWLEGAIEASPGAGPTSGVGMSVDFAWRVRGKRHDATCEVTAWRESELLAFETRVGGVLVMNRVQLSREERGTRVTVLGEVMYMEKIVELFARPIGLLGAAGVDPILQTSYERSLNSFCKLVESHSENPYR